LQTPDDIDRVDGSPVSESLVRFQHRDLGTGHIPRLDPLDGEWNVRPKSRPVEVVGPVKIGIGYEPHPAALEHVGGLRVYYEVREAGLQAHFGGTLLQPILDFSARVACVSEKINVVAIGRQPYRVKADERARSTRAVIGRCAACSEQEDHKRRTREHPDMTLPDAVILSVRHDEPRSVPDPN
jgi:hypothetical protein